MSHHSPSEVLLILILRVSCAVCCVCVCVCAIVCVCVLFLGPAHRGLVLQQALVTGRSWACIVAICVRWRGGRVAGRDRPG